jgi:UDP:flavonoid glycosyltransferase YjiC (YdhE family)
LGWFNGRRLSAALEHVLSSSEVARRCRELADEVGSATAFEAAADVVTESMLRRRGELVAGR